MTVVLAVFYVPYRTIVNQLISERGSDYGVGSDAHLGRYLTKLVLAQPHIDKLTLLCQGGYSPVLMYYKTKQNLSRNRGEICNLLRAARLAVCNREP